MDLPGCSSSLSPMKATYAPKYIIRYFSPFSKYFRKIICC
ncbi:hypothetical protein kac65v162_gp102 [Nodularia phage vB_NspS-kac65v162]|uniref:Uncharacterized protein n=5 Tax=Ravarandavirus TaxID=2843444 RepID=A0A482MLQ9_9CAUD|nr:hypothetical protein HWC12_gp102 [Nodularia phage vB_NspS-kac65v151]YP_009844913.1 hypothetical protein HWC13_gp104 [Nodularia phage vB_NspS-kac68v161]QBQ73340.1 hypothetical protein kac65v161_gp102 [Nodularia phage vB_NspS-kac65v161]QBQ73546.1 hypothetical protein kac65v162_gp102 [Nodularia phage vB_NspS-kac65v162]QBQ73950.1 hypothetical protein kac68v162_gp102 [Nodularia phage vB_NspS-kac68v162]QBQ73132.1 hypothetical protein kac65v151_gp102 [Nodularia phage vB_NspS-kac65v151]QBQ73754.1 